LDPGASAPGVGSVAAFPSEGAASAASRLKEEAALLRRARAELRAGALAQAFATLEASRREFTAPELTQEREALAIELLYRSGERAAAAKRAQDFLARYPESPHATGVRAFADSSR
jgi:outer membrane protein assembly factor BamD (BamD/ComL family)